VAAWNVKTQVPERTKTSDRVPQSDDTASLEEGGEKKPPWLRDGHWKLATTWHKRKGKGTWKTGKGKGGVT